MIRNQRKASSVTIAPGLALDLNPYASQVGARVLRNFLPERGRLARKTFSPQFTVKPTAAGGDVWHTRNFRYYRAGAPENKLITFRADGKVWDRQSTWEQELYPSTAATVAGPRSDSTATDLGASWTNPTNVASSNDARATTSFVTTGFEGDDTRSSVLLSDTFGFTLSTTTDIPLGIQVTLEGSFTTPAGGGVIELQVYDGSSSTGSKKTQVLSNTETTYAIGSSTDLWDTGASASFINSSSFGIGINVLVPIGFAGTWAASIDYVAVTIYYSTSLGSIITKKPFVQQLSNRLFFNDAVSKKVYDGRSVYNWGFDRTTTPPTVSAVAAGSLTAATGLKAAITWVQLDEEGNRVHESSRTNVSSFQVLAAENLRVDISALSAPTKATHWSAYVSELNGSEVLRRSATVKIGTNTTDVSSLPAATSPKAPIRNDPPPKSTVGCVAKNRIFLRDDAAPNTFYFSALGEVKGLLNGAAEESFPGYGSNSTSDIKNSDFVPDREIRAFVEHENIVFLWSEKYGYALVGELNLLDDRAPRSLVKLRQFSENCAGSDACLSTPYGLVWVNSGRRVVLWSGGQELLDIGDPIQQALDNIPNSELSNIYLHWWNGNGRQWLLICCKSSTPDDDSSSSLSNRVFCYDFSHPRSRTGGGQDPGTWFEWPDIAATCSSTYFDEEGGPFLLFGNTSSEVRLADKVCNPSHINTSCTLGETYLGATVQNNPRALIRTTNLMPAGDLWTTGQYLALVSGAQEGPGTPIRGSLTQPTVTFAVDLENPDNYDAISLTLDSEVTSGDRRAWLRPQGDNNSPSGPNSPTSVVDAGGGTNSWSNVNNSLVSDNVYATCNVTAGAPSTGKLTFTEFGFNIPSEATILGLYFEAEGKIDIGISNTVRFIPVLTSAERGTQSLVSPGFTTSDTYIVGPSGGSTSHLWGTTWTAKQINDPSFGFSVQCSAVGTRTFSVDHARATIYYTVNTNVGGAFGKEFMFEISYAAGMDDTGVTDNRETTRQNCIYKMAFTHSPQKEDAE